jgi:Uma2 family endonuclease
MTTALVLGPADHGRPISAEEFEAARATEGYRYELIDGKVYVSPVPNPPHDFLCEWLRERLDEYRRGHPEVINYISGKASVHVTRRRAPTWPEPDLAAYHNYPRHAPPLRWDTVNPALVVEVISEDDPEKDLERNLELYLQVPSIREYWVVDPRPDPDFPTLTVYRRRGSRWQNPIHVAPGETYTTKLLPGFTLLLDPHA